MANGFDVIATDPAANAEAKLRKYVDTASPDLTALGFDKDGSREKLSFTPDPKNALGNADFVQENGPEKKDFKVQLSADMGAATSPDSIIASSSSGLTMSVMQSACKRPERCVIGHPFNPPHMVSSVEMVGGAKTSAEVVRRAIDFYASLGKKPIHLRKEVLGHVANRLQAAIYREVENLINLGVVDVADADAAVCWKDLGSFTEWPEGSKETIAADVIKAANGRSVDELAQMRDAVLVERVKLRVEQVEESTPALAKWDGSYA